MIAKVWLVADEVGGLFSSLPEASLGCTLLVAK